MKTANVDLASGVAVSSGVGAVATPNVHRTRQRDEARTLGTVLVGLALCAVLPAAFWTMIIWLTADWFGVAPSVMTLLSTVAGIALFLSIIVSAMMANT